MSRNIIESVTFLTNVRDTLATIVEGSSVEEKEQLKHFIISEASDYEIMHMFLYEGDLPDVKHDLFAELKLFSKLRGLVELNSDKLMEIGMEHEDIKAIYTEVDSVSATGLSTAKPVLEHMSKLGVKTLKEIESKYWNEKAPLEILGEQGGGQKMVDVLSTQAGKVGDSIKDAKGVVSDEVAGQATNVLNKFTKAITTMTNQIKERGSSIARAAREGDTATVKRLEAEKAVLTKQLGQVKSEMNSFKATMNTIKGSVKQAAKVVGKEVGEKGVQAAQAVTGAAEKVGAGAKEVLANLAQKADSSGQLAAKIRGMSDVGTGAGVAVGGAVLAGLLGFAAVKTYKRFFSKAAGACKGKSGSDKTACIQGFKKQAIKAQIADLNKGLGGCKKAKDPAKCEYALKAKAQKLQKKLASV